MSEDSPSFKEQRIRKLTHLYYSRPEIQKAIFEFCKNREISPRYFEGFGKRPDTFEYIGDVMAMVKKGATSLHCSEEIWENPLEIVTGMDEKQLNKLRTGWDLLIDIDSKYLDYSKISAQVIINFLKFHGIKNIGVKFSGSKGFHIIIPWKAFPKEINEVKTSDMFPEYPRIITQYIMEKTKKQLIEKISELERPNKYIKDFQASEQVMPDIILVSPRHLFRTPYSLHEKTALASAVLTEEEISDFQMKDADPMKVKIRNFLPDSEEGEASELLMQALDWNKDNNAQEEKKEFTDFKPIKLENLSEANFPPCVKNILNGIGDGKKRALFVLISLFRSIGMEKDELEKRIYDWNKKNPVPLKEGYIKSQLSWSYRKKQIMPSNCKEFYQGIGVCEPDEMCKLIKNPVNYIIRKNLIENKENKENKKGKNKEKKKSKESS
ncbi:MAG: DNA primase small subunit domain-containing protein [archaeon]